MDDMKKAFDEYFSFTPEEEERLEDVSGEILELLKTKGLAIREALYVINKCEHAVFLDGIGEGSKG